jgi:hypothetical protein
VLSPFLPQMLGRTVSCGGAALTGVQVGWFLYGYLFLNPTLR